MFIFDIYFLSFAFRRDLMIIFCIEKPITVKYTVCKKLDNNSAKTFTTDCLYSTRSFHASNIKLSKLSSLLRFLSPYYSYYYAHKNFDTFTLLSRKNLFPEKTISYSKFYYYSCN